MGLMRLATIRLLAVVTTAALLVPPPPMASGQQITPGGAASCTASLLTSFTPCFSFLTSNNTSTPPTQECCRSLAALVNASTGCACLVLTGAVPLPALGVPVNRTLAVSLPKACDSTSVPLQCRGTSSSPAAQSPAAAPGPVADTPSTPASSTPATPTVDPTATPPVSQGQTRPAVLPSSAWRTTSAHVAKAPALVLLLAAVAAALV